MKVDESLIQKFFSRETTREEADAIAAWVKESPAHRAVFEREHKLFLVSLMALKGMSVKEAERRQRRSRGLRWALAGMAAAAAVALGIFFGHGLREPAHAVKDAMLVSEAKWGKQLTQTLSDGTVIEMNSGSWIEYPALFLGGERRVRLEGEAVFDVAHDAGRPFIVETYAYDVRVLGTRFDVLADEIDGAFSTTLLEGSVEVLDKQRQVLVRLQPNQVARRDETGTLRTETLEDAEEALLWREDLLSLSGIPFADMMRRFERTYGVRIVIDRANLPQEVLPYCKVRISEGIAAAFHVLQHHYDFDYTFDVEENTYHIR